MSSQPSKHKSVLDVTIIKLILEFEEGLYLYIDKAMPKKFKPTLITQLLKTLGEAREAAITAMDLHPHFKEDKFYHLNLTQAKLRNTEVLLNILNDLQSVSDKAKATFDIQLADIYGNLDRLLGSFARKIDEMRQTTEGTPTGQSSQIKRMPNCPENEE